MVGNRTYRRCAKILGFLWVIGALTTVAGCNGPSQPIAPSSEPIGMEGEATVFDQDAGDTEDKDIKDGSPDWSAITANGLEEEKFLEKLNAEDLKEVASELQALVSEVMEEERENPAIVITEGYSRVFEKPQYRRVIDMGERAEMPLYYIIYKSETNGMYEHVCAVALSELTGLRFMDDSGAYLQWSTAKEYLELFHAFMSREAD